MEGVDNKEEIKKTDSKFNQEIYTQIVRAGKRTYFFDVKSTRNNEYYLTITESKKRCTDQGKFHFEKHKIFLLTMSNGWVQSSYYPSISCLLPFFPLK